MQAAGPQADNLWSLIIVIAASLMCILGFGGIATAGYANSAHGSTSYGVDRSTPPCQYPNPSPPPEFLDCPTGSCAHCHDTFDEPICGVNDLMLFGLSNEDFYNLDLTVDREEELESVEQINPDEEDNNYQ